MKFTPEYLRSRFTYDPETGDLTFKPKPAVTCYDRMWNTKNAGRLVGQNHKNGKGKLYFAVTVDQVMLLSHRVIWVIVHGYEPEEIDHIDGDGRNNRISNLREVSRIENSRNHKRNSNNTSGVTGVYLYRRTGKWMSAIKVEYKNIHLGCYSDWFDAVCARKSAEIMYGFHRNHGSDRPL